MTKKNNNLCCPHDLQLVFRLYNVLSHEMMQTSCVIVSTGISPELSFTKWKKDAISIFENIEYTIRDYEIFKVPGERRVYYIFIICVMNNCCN